MRRLTSEGARLLAYSFHAGRTDRLGAPEIEHISRVAQGASARAKAVAWLHDAVEDGLTTFEALEAAGLSPVELGALRLVTRLPEDGSYMDYIRAIAAADGDQGEIAREVKDVDLGENMSRDAPAEMLDMRRPGGRYDRAKRIITGARRARGELPGP